MFFSEIRNWQPFRVDALGLVTIFGAENMQLAVGTLVRSWITEWLPVLGAYTVASNQIRQPQPGFVLYNITDGIVATDVCPWCTRWLLSYTITYASTTIRLKIKNTHMSTESKATALLLGILSTLPLLLFASILQDWWGFANIVAIISSVIIRQQMVSQLREAIDRAAANVMARPGADVKVFLTLPGGEAVTIYGPRNAIVNCILTDPRPVNSRLYSNLCLLGWGAFGVHAVTLGMATLISQICCVCMLLLCTFLKVKQYGDNPNLLGTRLGLDVDHGNITWSKSHAYARLALSSEEEEFMVRWNLFPQKENKYWWNIYKDKEAAIRESLYGQRQNHNNGGIAPHRPVIPPISPPPQIPSNCQQPVPSPIKTVQNAGSFAGTP